MERESIELWKLHESTIVRLAEEEAAFNRVAACAARVIMLKKEFWEMKDIEVMPAIPAPTNLISVITTAARDPGTDPGKLKELLEMAERMMRFEAERAFNDAMRACQDQIQPIMKTAQNTHTGTAYADLETIDRVIRPVYTSHGFCMSFGSAEARRERGVRATCDVRHSAGHTVRYELEGELDTAGAKGTTNKTGIAGLGSTVTHLRRYLTLMIWNITLTDQVPCLTREQADSVWGLIDAAGISGTRRRDFLRYARAETVETIPAVRYNDVVKQLEKARRKGYGAK